MVDGDLNEEETKKKRVFINATSQKAHIKDTLSFLLTAMHSYTQEVFYRRRIGDICYLLKSMEFICRLNQIRLPHSILLLICIFFFHSFETSRIEYTQTNIHVVIISRYVPSKQVQFKVSTRKSPTEWTTMKSDKYEEQIKSNNEQI